MTEVSEEDREAIIDAIGTFRIGSPIITFDVRIACHVDGHDISHVKPWELESCIRERCDSISVPHMQSSYYRRW